MTVSSREWFQDYDRAKRDIQEKRRSERTFSNKEKDVLTSVLGKLDSQLKQMGASPADYDVVTSEISRRKVLLKNLKVQLGKAVTSGLQPPVVTGTVEGASLSGVKAGVKSATPGSSSATMNPLLGATSTSGLQLRQEQVVKEQDEMLLDIADGMDRLRDKAKIIQGEVNMQGKLLDDLEENVEVGIDELHQEAEHAKTVREKSRAFYMYVCCIIEFLLLVVLVFIAFVK